ncbi:S8 family serine peptidase [Streptomyces roseochromogenus]|uniref:Peptidase S8/S53 domain-containing protein n=1 Tax=Streptomyces roseochromogenus subsp. oscitans DS 12.976 TaxID=1352936 RepID=V6K5H0_STRRC|nr:S8 family serine peptidase [Streptomyces roseochromogenus]EST24189.1 hypothetical protein M878_31390 [Streptomyces roseochromogenus subsp. oscitans DS 12.976]
MEARSILGDPAVVGGLLGDPRVCVAVLDGPVDLGHPCFAGADVRVLPTLVRDPAGSGPMALHGTHVTSLLFGQPSGPVTGVVPRCRGLLLPVFPDDTRTRVRQLDLARAIEQAVQAGAHIINISGGERTPDGLPDPMLERALKLCDDHRVLVVAAVGNDGCDCLQAPAATASVLAVGGLGADGAPLEINNWGPAYRVNGVLAPGEGIRGAAPGGGVRALTGSSFATPLVSGLAALLVADQLRQGLPPDPRAAGQAILATATATACRPDDAPHCRRFLAGTVSAPRAFRLIAAAQPQPATARPAAAAVAPQPYEGGAFDGSDGEGASEMDSDRQYWDAAHGAASMSRAVPGEGLHAAAGTPWPADGGIRAAASTLPPPDGGMQAAGNTLPPPDGGTTPPSPAAPPQPSPAAPPPPAIPPRPVGDPGVLASCACGCGGGPGCSEADGGVGPAAAQPPAHTPRTPAPGVVPADTAPAGAVPPAHLRSEPEARLQPSGLPGGPEGGALQPPSPELPGPASPHPAPGVRPACACATGTSGTALVYAIGTVGFDYTTEARRDSFRQAMPFVDDGQDDQGRPRTKQPDVYDPAQLRDYLITAPWAANNLAWTLMVDGAPVYALEAEPAIGMEYGETFDEERVRGAASDPSGLADLLVELARPPVSTVYRTFRDAIVGEALKPEDKNFVSLVSIPGVLTDRTTRLFSGQVVPVVEVKSRGLYTWNEAALVEDVIATVMADNARRNVDLSEDTLRKTVRALLDKLYYQFRNLGQTDADRALNYAGTNAFLLTSSFADGLLGAKYVPGDEDRFYSLDTITVSKSTYCRESSVCYDVVTTFFDPENELRSRLSFLQTIDVSIETPVSVAPVHQFLGAM